MSNFYGKRFLSVLMGALTVLGSSVASAGKRSTRNDTLGSGKSSSRRRSRRNVKKERGVRFEADREVKSMGGLRDVLKETDGEVVHISPDGKGGFVAFVKTPAGIVTVSVSGVSLAVVLSCLTYAYVSGRKKTDGGGVGPVDSLGDKVRNETSNDSIPKADEPKKVDDLNGEKPEEPEEEPKTLHPMSNLFYGVKKAEESFFYCLFRKFLAPSVFGNPGDTLSSFDNGKADGFFVNKVIPGFEVVDKSGEVVLWMESNYGSGSQYYHAKASADFHYFGIVRTMFEGTLSGGSDVCEVSCRLSKFISDERGIVLPSNARSFLYLMFFTCWYYAVCVSNKESFSVKSFNSRSDGESGKVFKGTALCAWDIICSYVDSLIEVYMEKLKGNSLSE